MLDNNSGKNSYCLHTTTAVCSVIISSKSDTYQPIITSVPGASHTGEVFFYYKKRHGGLFGGRTNHVVHYVVPVIIVGRY